MKNDHTGTQQPETEQVNEKRRQALAKIARIGTTGAAASIAILASTRASAGSPA